MTRTSDVFVLPGDDSIQNHVLATYSVEIDANEDIDRKAAAFAIGQTIGTWTDVPGVTEEMSERHVGRVTSLLPVPPVDLITQIPQRIAYLVQVALPSVNFGYQFPQLLTTLVGNDASTSMQAKLVDVRVPDAMAEALGGPRFGIEGVRHIVGVTNRPLVLNMIKPCTGLTPDQGAEIFYHTALGGPDLIKDDELLGNTSFSPLTDRVRSYLAAADRAFDETGHRTLYVPNITDRSRSLLDNAERAIEAGARAVMVAFPIVGYDMLQYLAERITVPILGHYAGAGMFYEGPSSGMSAAVALGTLPRLAGADLVMMNTPYGGYPLLRSSYLAVSRQLSLPHGVLRRTLPMVGGKVHPGVVERYLNDLGHDIVLSPGGAIQGHPMGPAAGVRAMFQAIDAAVSGVPADTYGSEHEELAVALDLWGYDRVEGGAS